MPIYDTGPRAGLKLWTTAITYRFTGYPDVIYQANECIILIAERLDGTIDMSQYDTWLTKSAITKVFIALDMEKMDQLNIRYPLIVYNNILKVFSVSWFMIMNRKLIFE